MYLQLWSRAIQSSAREQMVCLQHLCLNLPFDLEGDLKPDQEAGPEILRRPNHATKGEFNENDIVCPGPYIHEGPARVCDWM